MSLDKEGNHMENAYIQIHQHGFFIIMVLHAHHPRCPEAAPLVWLHLAVLTCSGSSLPPPKPPWC